MKIRQTPFDRTLFPHQISGLTMQDTLMRLNIPGPEQTGIVANNGCRSPVSYTDITNADSAQEI
jgi:hypothetical protein